MFTTLLISLLYGRAVDENQVTCVSHLSNETLFIGFSEKQIKKTFNQLVFSMHSVLPLSNFPFNYGDPFSKILRAHIQHSFSLFISTAILIFSPNNFPQITPAKINCKLLRK